MGFVILLAGAVIVVILLSLLLVRRTHACRECGARIRLDARFCPRCGAEAAARATAPAPAGLGRRETVNEANQTTAGGAPPAKAAQAEGDAIQGQPRADVLRRPQQPGCVGRSIAVLGWTMLALGAIAAYGSHFKEMHQRDYSIEWLMRSGDGRFAPGALGYTLGSNLLGILALLLGVALRWLSQKRRGRAMIVTALCCIVVTTIGVWRPTRGVMTVSEEQGRQAAKALVNLYDQMLPLAGRMPTTSLARVASKDSHGQLSHILRSVEDFAAGLVADANEYRSGVLLLRVDAVLHPTNLSSGERISESKARVASAKSLFEKYCKTYQRRTETLRGALTIAPYSAEERQLVTRSFDRGMAAMTPRVERLFRYEAAMYEELTVVLDFMLEQQGKFRLDGNEFRFDSEADAVTYNASLRRYQAIWMKEVALREAMLEQAKTNTEEMRSVANGSTRIDAPITRASDAPKRRELKLSLAGVTMDGKPLPLPPSITDLSDALGPPTRVLEGMNIIRTWDEAGIYAYSKPGSKTVTEIEVALTGSGPYQFSPKSEFSGRITIGNIEVFDIDTPRALNRRLKEMRFEPRDSLGMSWRINKCPKYQILMPYEKSGLCDVLIIVPDVSPPMP